MWRQALSLRISGPAGSSPERKLPGSATYAQRHTRTSSSATTASRFILMKVSTRLPTENSGSFARTARSGTTLSARSNGILHSPTKLKMRTTTAYLAQKSSKPLKPTRKNLRQLWSRLMIKMEMSKWTINRKTQPHHTKKRSKNSIKSSPLRA